MHIDNELYSTSIHEAAHAVADFKERNYVREATIVGDDSGNLGRCRAGSIESERVQIVRREYLDVLNLGMTGKCDWSDVELKHQEFLALQAEDNKVRYRKDIVSYLAGGYAQKAYGKEYDHTNCASDCEEARALVSRITSGKDDSDRILSECIQIADRLVQDEREVIESVALELLKHGTLSGNQLALVVQRLRPHWDYSNYTLATCGCNQS